MSANSDSGDSDNEVSEFHVDPDDRVGEHDVSIDSVSVKRRGRPMITEKWTGVINLEKDDMHRIKFRELSIDLMLAQGIPDPPKRKMDDNWEPLFFPKEWIKNRDEITLDDFRLEPEKFE
jgi:hypothetical protein